MARRWWQWWKHTRASDDLPVSVHPTHLCVGVVVTVPDVALIARVTGQIYTHAHHAVQWLMSESDPTARTQVTAPSSHFPKPLYHRIVATGMLHAPIQWGPDGYEYYGPETITCAVGLEHEEGALISGWFEALGRGHPRVVTYGGRRFVLPVLRCRGLHHRIAAPVWYRMDHASLRSYGRYADRWSHRWHCDVMEWWAHDGLAPRLRLSELCALIGHDYTPGCPEQFALWYDAGDRTRLESACLDQLAALYAVYRATRHHEGQII